MHPSSPTSARSWRAELAPIHPDAREARAMTDPDLRDLICLSMVAGVGPHTSRMLLERFGTPGKALDAPAASLRDVQGVGPKLAARIAAARREHDPEAELERCRSAGVGVVPADDPSYPRPLLDIPDPPRLLYVRGAYELRDELAIALV